MMLGLRQLLFGKDETLSKAEAKHQQKLATANEFFGITDIRGPFLYARDGSVFCYLHIDPVPLDLLSASARRHKVRLFAAEFAGEHKDFKWICVSQPIDISAVTAYLSTLYARTAEPIQKKLISDEIKAVSSYALTGQSVQRMFYMVIWEPYAVDVENELLRRAQVLQQKYERCDVATKLLDQEGIVRLCNLLANPAYAHLEDTAYDTLMPTLVGGEK
jgi:hypothetical protein